MFPLPRHQHFRGLEDHLSCSLPPLPSSSRPLFSASVGTFVPSDAPLWPLERGTYLIRPPSLFFLPPPSRVSWVHPRLFFTPRAHTVWSHRTGPFPCLSLSLCFLPSIAGTYACTVVCTRHVCTLGKVPTVLVLYNNAPTPLVLFLTYRAAYTPLRRLLSFASSPTPAQPPLACIEYHLFLSWFNILILSLFPTHVQRGEGVRMRVDITPPFLPPSPPKHNCTSLSRSHLSVCPSTRSTYPCFTLPSRLWLFLRLRIHLGACLVRSVLFPIPLSWFGYACHFLSTAIKTLSLVDLCSCSPPPFQSRAQRRCPPSSSVIS